jgi:hypothetical protein
MESRRSKGWWGYGGVAAVGTGGAMGARERVFPTSRKQDKTRQDKGKLGYNKHIGKQYFIDPIFFRKH